VLRTIPRIDVQVVRLNPGVSAAAALAAYRASPLVQYAEQDVYVYSMATPNDTFYGLQWHYPTIGLPAAWGVTTGSPVIVAVVDSGIRFDHPDLAGVTVAGWDYFANDPNPTDPGCTAEPNGMSHGTHVAGTVAALTNNSIGVAGVAWGGASGVKIMPIRVLGQIGSTCGTGTDSMVANGIIHAADNGAKVINLSLGGPGGTQTLQDAVNHAHSRGVTLVASAGNDNGPVGYPAAYPNVIAVAATACNNAKASYSNFGPEVDIAAPGGDMVDCTGDNVAEWILSTWWSPNAGNDYWYAQGTSMAAPHVSGVAALLISRGVVGPAAIQARLQSTATDLAPSGWDPHFGWGLVNAAAAVGANNPGTAMRAFSGIISGSAITRQSDMVLVNAAGGFFITNALSGTKTVFAWQDFNGNGAVDANDYYGRADGVVINPGGTTTGVNVVVRRYTGSSLSVSGTANGSSQP
jgi:serine protease